GVGWPVASLAGVGWWRFEWWSFLDQRRQAFAPNPGARCLRRPSGGACAASCLGSEGGGTSIGCFAACGPGPDPSSHRRLTEAERSGAIKPHHTLLWCGLVRLDSTGPLSLASPADATRDPEPSSVAGVRHRSGIAALTPAAAGLFETDCRVPWKNVDIR